MTHRRTLTCLAILAVLAGSEATALAGSGVEFVPRNPNVTDILIQGKLFATWRVADTLNHVILTRPVLWPILTPEGTPITRDWPLRVGRREEPTDHPHHWGLWLAYGKLRLGDQGPTLNTWALYHTEPGAPPSTTRYPKGREGIVRCVENVTDPERGTIRSLSEWIDLDTGEPFLREERTMRFRGGERERQIDFVIRLQALEQSVTFEDSKEGFLALRVAPALTEDKKDTATVAGFPPGHARYLNASGAEGERQVWGKRSPWMALRGTLETGEPVTIVFMDHPDNVNHPAPWMARGYGLFAVNPFGLADFTRGRERFDFRLPPTGSVTFKYRILFHFGRLSTDEIVSRFELYSQGQ